jgi:hypothetical protein
MTAQQQSSNCGRSVFVGKLCMDTSKQCVGYLAHQFETAALSCKARGWTVVGCVMSSAFAELPSMDEVKAGDKFGTAFAHLRCATDVANLLIQDVLMNSNVASDGPPPASPFDDWRRTAATVCGICYFVNSHPKFRATLKYIMLELVLFKCPQVLMPLTQSGTRIRSVVFTLVRFLNIADQLNYLFNHKGGQMACALCASENHPKVKEFGRSCKEEPYRLPPDSLLLGLHLSMYLRLGPTAAMNTASCRHA